MTNKSEKYMLQGFSMENIRNKYEVRVIKILQKLLPLVPEFDGCQLCTEDVYALTMKNLPPMYAQKGSITLKHEITEADIKIIARFSINQVIQKPGHDI